MTAQGSFPDTLVVLDDCAEVAGFIGELARRAGYVATVTTDVETFNTAVASQNPGLITLDLQMPEADGIEVLRGLSACGCTAGILLISGMDTRTIVSAERFGRQSGLNVLESVKKPFDPETLVARLRSHRSIAGQLMPEDLGAAIHDDNLRLRYQLVVRRLGPRSWHAESVEALPRWKHPDFGVVAPRQFLPLIRSGRSELMRDLTDYVLQQGAAQLRQWQSGGLHLGLRVNVPATLIGDTAFPDRLVRLLREYSVDPALLTLELSEASRLAGSRDGVEILTRLRLQGINLSLDESGSNVPAYQCLYVLPASEAKLDRRIIADITREKGAIVVFRGLIEMLRELDIESCAVGVETSEELELLDEMQCDLVQGFYVGTPIPAAEVPKAVSAWTAESALNRQYKAAVDPASTATVILP